MSADLNTVGLVGRLTRDPELRYTAAGEAVCALRLAVSTRTRADEGWEDRPNFFDVSVWGKGGEAAAEHLAKGRRIGVAGRLAWREWTTDDGSRREAVQIMASSVQYLDAPTKSTDPTPVGAANGKGAAGGDDIPF
ncbi:MAG: single-stranded DNA-binding protein [Thermoleophilia bacterium]|nr:single-stranded DNA-binding protein [Thermoleophilia bacterium]